MIAAPSSSARVRGMPGGGPLAEELQLARTGQRPDPERLVPGPHVSPSPAPAPHHRRVRRVTGFVVPAEVPVGVRRLRPVGEEEADPQLPRRDLPGALGKDLVLRVKRGQFAVFRCEDDEDPFRAPGLESKL